MSLREVESKIESIIAFAKLAAVIDLPFRTYSSGMQARFTFATTINIDPDILIIDEALSVGDGRFQLKCCDTMHGLISHGNTIRSLRDVNAVAALCRRAIILEGGRVCFDGDTRLAPTHYHQVLFGPDDTAAANPAETEASSSSPSVSSLHPRKGSGEGQFIAWGLRDENGREITRSATDQVRTFHGTFVWQEKIPSWAAGTNIKNKSDIVCGELTASALRTWARNTGFRWNPNGDNRRLPDHAFPRRIFCSMMATASAIRSIMLFLFCFGASRALYDFGGRNG